MKVTQKKVDGGKYLLECVASEEDVSRAFYSAAVEFANRMGLRPEGNKTVEEICKEKLGIKDLDSMVEGSVLQHLAPVALNKKDIIPLYPPEPMPTSELKRGRTFSFTMRVTPKPNYELSSYDPVEITVQPFTPDLSDVDNQLNQMKEMYASYVDVDKGDKLIEKGDTVLLAINASIDGEPLKGLNTDGRPYEAGSGYMPEQFEEAILGMKMGESKTFTFEGPNWDADGNETVDIVDCTVEIKGWQERQEAEIDDEWIAKNMPMYRSVADLRKSIETQLTRQQRDSYDLYLRNMAAQEAAKRFQGKIEDAAYESASKQLNESLHQQAAAQNMTWDQFVEANGGQQQFQMLTMLEVRQQLTTGFALDAIFRKKKLVVSEEDILDACASINPQRPQAVRKELEESGRGFVLREAAERACAAKYLVAHAIIHEAASGNANEPKQEDTEE